MYQKHNHKKEQRMIETFRNDRLFVHLLTNSFLTEAQIDTILADRKGKSLKGKLALRNKTSLSEGSFMRTLRQGQYNIERTMYTLFLLEYLDLLESRKLDQIARTGSLIRQLETSPEGIQRSELFNAMASFIRECSGR